MAKKLGIIAAQPTAVWLGEWYDSSTLVRVLRAETQAPPGRRGPPWSDGDGNGGPAAGSWFEKAALDLVARRQT